MSDLVHICSWKSLKLNAQFGNFLFCQNLFWNMKPYQTSQLWLCWEIHLKFGKPSKRRSVHFPGFVSWSTNFHWGIAWRLVNLFQKLDFDILVCLLIQKIINVVNKYSRRRFLSCRLKYPPKCINYMSLALSQLLFCDPKALLWVLALKRRSVHNHRFAYPFWSKKQNRHRRCTFIHIFECSFDLLMPNNLVKVDRCRILNLNFLLHKILYLSLLWLWLLQNNFSLSFLRPWSSIWISFLHKIHSVFNFWFLGYLGGLESFNIELCFKLVKLE